MEKNEELDQVKFEEFISTLQEQFEMESEKEIRCVILCREGGGCIQFRELAKNLQADVFRGEFLIRNICQEEYMIVIPLITIYDFYKEEDEFGNRLVIDSHIGTMYFNTEE